MTIENRRGKIFTRRALILGGIKSFFLFSLVGRLYYLQIIKAKRFTTLADSNRIKLFLIPPLRGNILDRNNKLLAGNKNYYRILFDPQHSLKAEKTIIKLSKVLDLNEEKTQLMLKKMKNHKSRSPLLLYQHLTWRQVAKVEVNSPELPGVFIDVGQIRNYPTSEVSSHVVGYLGPVPKKEIEANPLLNHPDFKIGKSGTEIFFESTLRGKAGVKKMEVNAFGLSVREISREESRPGNDIKLTLDLRLQNYIGTRLEKESAAVTVMDVINGDVLALVSTPGFDPNQFTYGVSNEYYNMLLNHPNHPFVNKTLENQYPPGSTFKLIVALAALQEGIDPYSQVYCPGFMNLGRRRFHCWKEEGHGYMDMTSAIQQSCNTYFYTMAKKIGVDAIANIASLFGLGEKTGIILPGEKLGLVPNRRWKKKKYNEQWQQGDTLNIGIGQGYMLVTPIQLSVMAARIASGKKIVPTLSFASDATESKFADLQLPEKNLQLVRKGMELVVNTQRGTAYYSRITDNNFKMAGKTGTSQVVSKKYMQNNMEKLNEDELKKRQHHALFIGFAPVEHPRYAISVIVENGGSGSGAAAPVARDILKKLHEFEQDLLTS